MRRTFLGVVAIVLATLGGCGPIDDRGKAPKSGEWDGTKLMLCNVPPGVPPGKVFGPKPGFVHILVVITADIWRIKDNREVCVPNAEIPFTIWLDARLDGQPAFKLDRARPLPWSAELATPHFEHLYVPLTAKGRIWSVVMHATHTERNVSRDSIPRSYIRCAIFVDGKQVARSSSRISLGGSTASCKATGSTS